MIPEERVDDVISKVLDLKTLLTAAFTLQGTTVNEGDKSLQSAGSKLSIWADKMGNQEDKAALNLFNLGLKKILNNTDEQDFDDESDEPLRNLEETTSEVQKNEPRQTVNPLDSFMHSLSEFLKKPGEMDFGGRVQFKLFLQSHKEVADYLRANFSKLSEIQNHYINDNKIKSETNNIERPNQMIWFANKRKIIHNTVVSLNEIWNSLQATDNPTQKKELSLQYQALTKLYQALLNSMSKSQLTFIKEHGYWTENDNKTISSLYNERKIDEYLKYIDTRFYRIEQSVEIANIELFRAELTNTYQLMIELYSKIQTRSPNLPQDELNQQYANAVGQYQKMSDEYMQKQIALIKTTGKWTSADQKSYEDWLPHTDKAIFKNYVDNQYKKCVHQIVLELGKITKSTEKFSASISDPKSNLNNNSAQAVDKTLVFRKSASTSSESPQLDSNLDNSTSLKNENTQDRPKI